MPLGGSGNTRWDWNWMGHISCCSMQMMWIYWKKKTNKYHEQKHRILINATQKDSLEVNAGKTKYMLLCHHENAGQNHNIKTANRCFENVAQFRYLTTAVTNQNLIQEEIKRRLNSGDVFYHSVQNILSSCLLSKNIKIRMWFCMGAKLGLWH
jgi:hypothetical protein